MNAADALHLATILNRIEQLAMSIGEPLEAQVGPRFIRLVIDSHGQRHVHAFVDRQTGDIIKSATWKAPQKGKNGLAVRGNLLDPADFTRLLSVADKYGSYLYASAGPL